MSAFNLTELINTLSIQTYSYESERMERYIIKQLKKKGLEHTRDAYGNIYVTKGEASLYPTMVCHIDTVHKVNLNSIVRRHQDTLYSIDKTTYERTGIGGDDKVGVYITLACLDYLPNFKAVFFKDEEVGCVGSSQADFSFFDNSTIVLECDRKGMGDFVTEISGVDLSNKELLTDIEDVLDTYGRKPKSGGITDVKEIALKNKVQVANINCGYYNPHTDDEYVNIVDVADTLNFCLDVFDVTMHKRYEMELKDRYSYNYGGYAGYGGSRSYYNDWYGGYEKPKQRYNQPVVDEIDGVKYYDYGTKWYKWTIATQEWKAITLMEYEDAIFGDDSAYTSYDYKQCPQCLTSDTMYDDTMDANFCFQCNEYFQIESHEA